MTWSRASFVTVIMSVMTTTCFDHMDLCGGRREYEVASVTTNTPTPCMSQPSSPSSDPSGGLHVHPLADQTLCQFDNMTPHHGLKMRVQMEELQLEDQMSFHGDEEVCGSRAIDKW